MVYSGLLEGRIVILKSVDIDDAEFTYEIRQDTSKTMYVHKLCGGVNQQREWINMQRQREGDYFFLVSRKSGEPIGTYGIYNIRGKSADSGRVFMLGNQVEFIEAAILIHDFAFKTLELGALYSDILEGNTAAIGSNKRFGGIEEGRTYDLEFKMNMIHTVIRQDAYFSERAKLIKLVERFEGRLRGGRDA